MVESECLEEIKDEIYASKWKKDQEQQKLETDRQPHETRLLDKETMENVQRSLDKGKDQVQQDIHVDYQKERIKQAAKK